MQIVETDFILKPSSEGSNFFDLTFYKRVKKRDTGKFEMEPKDTLYGLSLSSALIRIIHNRTQKKFEEDNITLFEFLKEFQSQYKQLIALCHESMPEKFDTGD